MCYRDDCYPSVRGRRGRSIGRSLSDRSWKETTEEKRREIKGKKKRNEKKKEEEEVRDRTAVVVSFPSRWRIGGFEISRYGIQPEDGADRSIDRSNYLIYPVWAGKEGIKKDGE